MRKSHATHRARDLCIIATLTVNFALPADESFRRVSVVSQVIPRRHSMHALDDCCSLLAKGSHSVEVNRPAAKPRAKRIARSAGFFKHEMRPLRDGAFGVARATLRQTIETSMRVSILYRRYYLIARFVRAILRSSDTTGPIQSLVLLSSSRSGRTL